MIGNVWEWTTDWYSQKHEADAPKACCIPENPRGGREDGSYDPALPDIRIARKVIKGGSHLARRTIAAAIGRPRAMRSRSTRPRATSVFDASAKASEASNQEYDSCLMLA